MEKSLKIHDKKVGLICNDFFAGKKSISNYIDEQSKVLSQYWRTVNKWALRRDTDVIYRIAADSVKVAMSYTANNSGHSFIPIVQWGKLMTTLDQKSNEYREVHSSKSNDIVQLFTKYLDTVGDSNSSTFLWAK